MHYPSNGEHPHPGASSVKALDGVVSVQWVEEQETCLLVVLRGAHGIQENKQKYYQWS
jgi:hypothetical protein